MTEAHTNTADSSGVAGPGRPAPFTVDPWDPGYATALTDAAAADLDTSSAQLNVELEAPSAQWAPRTPPPDAWAPDEVLIVDGVRRVDARIWFAPEREAVPSLGLAGSWAAGVVRLNGAARVDTITVERGVFTPCGSAAPIHTPIADYPIRPCAGGDPVALSLALQQRLVQLEVDTATALQGSNDLLMADGPLRGRQHLPRAVGYIKTHHAAYLPPELNMVVSALGPGQRTPVFTVGTSWSRHSWYVKLPVQSAAPWAGVVRCECSVDLRRDDAIRLADTVTLLLPRLASAAHKDPRAPQNLVPIGGLERLLRHRLGDARKLHRQLSVAASHRPWS